MTQIVWDKTGSRLYETGVDRGVLYLANGLGVPWNGLSAVDVQPEEASTEPVYFDGVKRFDYPIPGDFTATLKAITYPDEFNDYDGMEVVSGGLFVDNQYRKKFGLSYRTLIGSDTNPDLGYKLHICYGLTAVPQNVSHVTIGSSATPTEFSWTVSGLPQVVPGKRPSAHFVIDSRKIGSTLLSYIESVLYGTSTAAPRLPSVTELIGYLSNTVFIVITDNGDGTWTATGPDSLFTLDPVTQEFTITDANAVFIDADTYTVSSS